MEARTVLVKVSSHRALHKLWRMFGYDTATFYAPNTKAGTWLYVPIGSADEVRQIKGVSVVRDRWDLRRHRSFS